MLHIVLTFSVPYMKGKVFHFVVSGAPELRAGSAVFCRATPLLPLLNLLMRRQRSLYLLKLFHRFCTAQNQFWLLAWIKRVGQLFWVDYGRVKYLINLAKKAVSIAPLDHESFLGRNQGHTRRSRYRWMKVPF